MERASVYCRTSTEERARSDHYSLRFQEWHAHTYPRHKGRGARRGAGTSGGQVHGRHREPGYTYSREEDGLLVDAKRAGVPRKASELCGGQRLSLGPTAGLP